MDKSDSLSEKQGALLMGFLSGVSAGMLITGLMILLRG